VNRGSRSPAPSAFSGTGTPACAGLSTQQISRTGPSHAPSNASKTNALCFDIDTKAFCRNSPVLKSMQNHRGVYPPPANSFVSRQFQTAPSHGIACADHQEASHGAIDVADESATIRHSERNGGLTFLASRSLSGAQVPGPCRPFRAEVPDEGSFGGKQVEALRSIWSSFRGEQVRAVMQSPSSARLPVRGARAVSKSSSAAFSGAFSDPILQTYSPTAPTSTSAPRVASPQRATRPADFSRAKATISTRLATRNPRSSILVRDSRDLPFKVTVDTCSCPA